MDGEVADLPRLIALSPGTLQAAAVPAFLQALARALGAGLPGLLLREPGLEDREFLALGARVNDLRVTHASLWFAIHDRAHLARALRADALHLSFRSLSADELRPWLGPELLLGLSTHAHDARATWRSADYLFHGPLHATPSKAGRLEPVGFAGIARAARMAGRPVYALGGVRPQDVAPARAAGAHGVAVLSGILGADDAALATRAYLAAAPA